MFEFFLIKPIFNLLVLIQALIPGHNFGLAIIIFTIIVRFLMWPLVRKQLRQTKAMREMQPEIKKIKKAAKGNRQQESLMLMELYKERQINPFSSIGTLVVQLIIILGLYSGLNRVVNDPKAVVDFSYGFIRDLGWVKDVAANVGAFDDTLFGVVDLSRAAVGNAGFYFPAFLLVAGSALSQYFQSSQLMPNDKDARSLKQILKDASSGKPADQSEANAAVTRSMKYFIPALIFLFTISLASALSLYWMVSGIVAYFQQSHFLKQDETDMTNLADKTTVRIIEGEVVTKETVTGTKTKGSKKKSARHNKRRK